MAPRQPRPVSAGRSGVRGGGGTAVKATTGGRGAYVSAAPRTLGAQAPVKEADAHAANPTFLTTLLLDDDEDCDDGHAPHDCSGRSDEEEAGTARATAQEGMVAYSAVTSVKCAHDGDIVCKDVGVEGAARTRVARRRAHSIGGVCSVGVAKERGACRRTSLQDRTRRTSTMRRMNSAPALTDKSRQPNTGELLALTSSNTAASLTPTAPVLDPATKADERVLARAKFAPRDSEYYAQLPLEPCLGWYKGLVERSGAASFQGALAGLKVRIAETLCFTTSSERLLLQPSPKGVVTATGDEAACMFLSHADQWSRAAEKSSRLCLVQKTVSGQPTANRTVLLKLEHANEFMKRPIEVDFIVLQRFIAPKRSASLLRVAWRGTLAPRGFCMKGSAPALVRNHVAESDCHGGGDATSRWIVSADQPGTYAIELKSVPVKAARIAHRVAVFTQKFFHIRLTQLVVDVVQDQEGVYHFLQVKAFTVQPQWLHELKNGEHLEAQRPVLGDTTVVQEEDSANTRSEVIGMQQQGQTASCGMCSCLQPVNRLSRRMTAKMMLETEHHLRKHGVQLFHVGRVRKISLAQAALVCDACWGLFQAVSELCKVQSELAVALNIEGCDNIDETAVPYGGVLAAAASESAPVDLSSVCGWRRCSGRDSFRLQDPEPAPMRPHMEPSDSMLDAVLSSDAWVSERLDRPPAVSSTRRLHGMVSPQTMASIGGGLDGKSSVPAATAPAALDASATVLLGRPRRGGEAVLHRPPTEGGPLLEGVPPVVMQWRLLVHLCRFVDLELPGIDSGSVEFLRVQLDIPWREQPQEFEVPLYKRTVPRSTTVSLSRTTLHYLFTNPGASHPMRGFLQKAIVRVRVHVHAKVADGACDDTLVEVLSGSFSLERMLDSPDGFLGQVCVMLSSRTHATTTCPALKLTLGMVCDQPVLSDYVVSQRFVDVWVPTRPYFSSHALPLAWVATIIADSAGDGGPTGGSAGDDNARGEANRVSPREATRVSLGLGGLGGLDLDPTNGRVDDVTGGVVSVGGGFSGMSGCAAGRDGSELCAGGASTCHAATISTAKAPSPQWVAPRPTASTAALLFTAQGAPSRGLRRQSQSAVSLPCAAESSHHGRPTSGGYRVVPSAVLIARRPRSATGAPLPARAKAGA